MKRFTYIILASACVAALFSCSRKYEFQTNSYAIIDTGSLTVKEDVGVVRIPVSAYNSDGLSGSVYFNVIDGTAVQGTDFTVEPASGVIAFDGNGTKFIDISVIEHAGVLTGPLAFSIELTQVSGSLQGIGGTYYTEIVIQDNDIVVDWDYIIGEWTADDGEGPYKVEFKQVNDNTLKLVNLWDEGQTIEGTITFDTANNSADINFGRAQVVYISSSYGPVGAYGLNGNSLIDMTAKVTSGGIVIGPWIGIILTGDYAGYSFSGSGGGYGGNTTLTK